MYVYICVYIYIEREGERDVYSYTCTGGGHARRRAGEAQEEGSHLGARLIMIMSTFMITITNSIFSAMFYSY